MRLRAAGQAFGRPGAAIVQVGVVFPGEQSDGGFGHLAVGLAGLQPGDQGRGRGIGRVRRDLGRGVPGGRLGALEGGEHLDTGVRDLLDGDGRSPESLPLLGERNGCVEAPLDAADRFRGGGEQKLALGPVQRGLGVLALAKQDGGGGVEGGDSDPPGRVQARR